LFHADVKLKEKNGQLQMITAVDGDVNRLFFPFFFGSFLVEHILQQVHGVKEEQHGWAKPRRCDVM